MSFIIKRVKTKTLLWGVLFLCAYAFALRKRIIRVCQCRSAVAD